MRAATTSDRARLAKEAASRQEPSGASVEALFADLVRTYHRDVQSYVCSLLADLPAAEDVTQDTFLRAYLALPRVGAPDNPRAWLLRIATNLTIDHQRRRSRLRFVSIDRIAHLLRAPDRTPPLDASDAFGRALGALSPDQRAVLMLFAHLGLTAPEVAEVLRISPAAARKRRQRAREAFTRAYRREAST